MSAFAGNIAELVRLQLDVDIDLAPRFELHRLELCDSLHRRRLIAHVELQMGELHNDSLVELCEVPKGLRISLGGTLARIFIVRAALELDLNTRVV